MFYGFDWTYVVFILPCVIISLICQINVSSTFKTMSSPKIFISLFLYLSFKSLTQFSTNTEMNILLYQDLANSSEGKKLLSTINQDRQTILKPKSIADRC